MFWVKISVAILAFCSLSDGHNVMINNPLTLNSMVTYIFNCYVNDMFISTLYNTNQRILVTDFFLWTNN